MEGRDGCCWRYFVPGTAPSSRDALLCPAGASYKHNGIVGAAFVAQDGRLQAPACPPARPPDTRPLARPCIVRPPAPAATARRRYQRTTPRGCATINVPQRSVRLRSQGSWSAAGEDQVIILWFSLQRCALFCHSTREAVFLSHIMMRLCWFSFFLWVSQILKQFWCWGWSLLCPWANCVQM